MRSVWVSASLPPAPSILPGSRAEERLAAGRWDGGDTPAPGAVLPGWEGRPRSTTGTGGSPTGRDEAGGLARGQWVTLMGYDRHRQRSVRAASGTVRRGSRIQPE